MRVLFLLTFVLFVSNSFCQNELKPQITKKIIISYNDSTIEAYVLTKNIKIRTHNEVSYFYYQANRINSNKGAYAGKPMQGIYKVFNNSGNIITQGHFKKGVKSGEWKSWYKNGEIKNIGRYKRGLSHGQYSIYSSAGKLMEIKHYKKGILHGKQIVFVNDEKSIKNFRNGKEKPKWFVKNVKSRSNWYVIRPDKAKKVKKEEASENKDEGLFKKLFKKDTEKTTKSSEKPKKDKKNIVDDKSKKNTKKEDKEKNPTK